LGIEPGRMSEQLQKVAAGFGSSAACARSAEGVALASGVEVSPNRVRRATLEVGKQVMKQQAKRPERRQDLGEPLRQRREGPQPQPV